MCVLQHKLFETPWPPAILPPAPVNRRYYRSPIGLHTVPWFGCGDIGKEKQEGIYTVHTSFLRGTLRPCAILEHHTGCCQAQAQARTGTGTTDTVTESRLGGVPFSFRVSSPAGAVLHLREALRHWLAPFSFLLGFPLAGSRLL